MIEHRISLRLCKESARPPQRVVVRRGDNGSQTIAADISGASIVTADNVGEVVTSDPSWNKRLCILHSDETWTKLPATSWGGTLVKSTLSNEATASHGRCKLAYFEFFKGEDSLSTEDFDLVILPDVGTETHEEAKSYNEEMIKLRAAWDTFQAIAKANESTRVSNESARSEAEKKRGIAESNRISAEDERVTAENRRKTDSKQLTSALAQIYEETEALCNQTRAVDIHAMEAAESAKTAAKAANGKLAELNAVDAVNALDKYQKSVSDHMNILRGTDDMYLDVRGFRNVGWSESIFNPRNYINAPEGSPHMAQPNVDSVLIKAEDSPDGKEHLGVSLTIFQTNVTKNSTPGFAQNLAYLKRGFYTFSVWLKGEVGTTVNIETFFDPFQDGNNHPIGDPGDLEYTNRIKQVVLDTNKWTRVSNTAFYPDNGLCHVGYVYLMAPMRAGNMVLACMPKLERSKTLTDYAPQPYFGGMPDYLMRVRRGVTLFNNPGQPVSGRVTLTDNTANYRKIEIYYRFGWRVGFVTVCDPNGRFAACSVTEVGSDSKLHVYAKTISIVADTIDTYKDGGGYVTGQIALGNNSTYANKKDAISVIRVVGYKDYE